MYSERKLDIEEEQFRYEASYPEKYVELFNIFIN